MLRLPLRGLWIGLLACSPTRTAADVAVRPDAAAGALCSPWGARGFTVTASSQAGFRRDFVRTFVFDDASGALSVHDEDPYAVDGGTDGARVLDRSLRLSTDEHEALTRELVEVCPDARQRAAQCAPGGCVSLEVRSPAKGTTVLQDATSVGAVMGRFERLFPELRVAPKT